MLDPKIDLTCPGCGRKFQQALSRLKKNARIPCPGCHQAITIEGDGANKVSGALQGMSNLFKKGGR